MGQGFSVYHQKGIRFPFSDGFQKIPEKYKYKSWTPDYIRMNGICELLLGGCWFILGFVLRAVSMPLLQELGLGLFFALPAVGYALYADRKTKAWRRQAGEEWRRKKQES